MANEQFINPFNVTHATTVGPPPIVMKMLNRRSAYMVEGGPQANWTLENYVLLSALPTELQERVKAAIQALVAGR